MADHDSVFLIRASEAAFDLGSDGYLLTSATIATRQLAFTDTGTSPEPPRYADGAPPVPGREGRREHDWQPAADAPGWMQLAWLLEDLATWAEPLAEEDITLAGLESPVPDRCDVLLRDGDTAYRVRIGLTGRNVLLDFPGMYLRDLFTEGRHHARLTHDPAHPTPVVDLRGLL